MSVIATLYEDANFGGQSFTDSTAGYRYHWNTWGGHNDFFSSMRASAAGNRGNAYAFENIDFSGRFAALNVGGRYTNCWWSYFGDDFNDVVSSSLIVAREPAERESSLQLRALVTGQFATIFDAKVAGKPVSRNGDPRLYGTFFPSWDSGRVFVTIDQALTVQVRIPLTVTIPNPFGDDIVIDLGTFRWSDYAARVRYDIAFAVDDRGTLHGWAAWSHVWVESGVFSSRVHDDLAPGLHAAKADLTAAIEGALALFATSKFADAYILPGQDPDMNVFGAFGRYDDDATLVLVKA
jgi:hypothetical protein